MIDTIQITVTIITEAELIEIKLIVIIRTL